MLSEQFLNLSCFVSLYDHKDFSGDLIDNVKEILDFYANDPDGIPVQFSHKFELARVVADQRVDGKSSECVIDSVISSGKFNDMVNFLDRLMKNEIRSGQISDACVQIKNRKKLICLISDYPKIKKFINSFDNNSFETIEAALDSYSELLNSVYSSYMDEQRYDQISSIKSLDLSSDSYEPALEQIQKNYSGEYSVPSGFNKLDKCLHGGFQPGRLYIFAGASNEGKSTLLINFLKNAISSPRDKNFDKKNIYVYITMENLLDESLLRLYSCVSKKPCEFILHNFEGERKNFEPCLKEVQEKNKTVLDMTYFPAGNASVSDIIGYVDRVKERYKDVGVIRGIYIDYLDLLKPTKHFDLMRVELGQITIDMKVMGILLNCPVITVTQLNRAAYSKTEVPSLTNMGESIKKVEHADMVCLMQTLEDKPTSFTEDEFVINIEIAKNRSGPKNKRIKLKADFSCFSIEGLGDEEMIRFTETVDVEFPSASILP